MAKEKKYTSIIFFAIMKKKTSYSLARTKLEERKKWITHDEMMNVTVIAESTPDRLLSIVRHSLDTRKRVLLGQLQQH